jgi:exodeoxyribonuclease VII small subunit
MSEKKTSVKSKSLQEKLTELDELVEWFNHDDFALEEAVGQFKKADALAREIEDDLAKIKNDITVLAERFDA